jgi:hypothetical protein
MFIHMIFILCKKQCWYIGLIKLNVTNMNVVGYEKS